MADGVLFTTQIPALTNVSEGQNVTLGTVATFADDEPITGVQFWAPDTPIGTYQGVVWEATADDSPVETGTGTILGTTDAVDGSLLASSAYNKLPLTSVGSITPDPAKTYVFGLRTSAGRYAATGAFWTADITNDGITGLADGDVTALGTMANGRFLDGSIVGYPNKTFNKNGYFVGPVRAETILPAEGSASFTLDLAPAAQGAREAAGHTALGLGLGVDADGARTSAGAAALHLSLGVHADGARVSAGAAALGLGLGVDADGARNSQGLAELGLGLGVDATGARASGGASAFALDLATAAQGSAAPSGSAAFGLTFTLAASGEAPPVVPPAEGSVTFHLNLTLAATGAANVRCLPFPWACADLPAFPGTCSPVPSFSEVTP